MQVLKDKAAIVTGASLGIGRATLGTNLTSAFLGARSQIPAMIERGGGSLIFTSTFVGHSAGMPGMTAYAASKAGLVGLTQVRRRSTAPGASGSTPSCPAAPTRRWGAMSPTRRRARLSSRDCTS